jgi:hypothetical protein
VAPSDRSVEPTSRKRVQQFNGKTELLGFSQRGIRILRVLGTPNCTASDATKIVGCSKSLVYHWKDHAIKVGALQLQTDGIVKYYELTPFGVKVLAGSTDFTTGEQCNAMGTVHVLEDHAVKFEVLKEETHPIDVIFLVRSSFSTLKKLKSAVLSQGIVEFQLLPYTIFIYRQFLCVYCF